jgi:hypothetical protein
LAQHGVKATQARMPVPLPRRTAGDRWDCGVLEPPGGRRGSGTCAKARASSWPIMLRIGAAVAVTVAVKTTQARMPVLLAPLHQVLVQMAEAGELARVLGVRRGLQLAPPAEIATAKKVGDADYGGAHGTVFVRALCPGQIVVNPQMEAHQPSLYRLNMLGFAGVRRNE